MPKTTEKQINININLETALTKVLLILFVSLISTPYILFILNVFINQTYGPILPYEIRELTLTAHLFLINLLLTIIIYFKREKQINFPFNALTDFLLLSFLFILILSYFNARYKSTFLYEIFYWAQSIYLYFIISYQITDDAKNGINRLITTFISTGTFIAIASFIDILIWPRSNIIPRNPLAEYLVLPLFLVLYRLYFEQTPAKRIVYWSALFSILLFIAVSKCRAVWVGLPLSFLVLCLLEKNYLAEFGRIINRHFWDKIIIIGASIILIILCLNYNKQLDEQNLVGIDKTVISYTQIDRGSIVGRIKLWGNSLFILKDHWLTGIGLNNWVTTYFQYNKKLFYDSGSDNLTPNNFFLKLAIEIGIPGTILFMVFLYQLFSIKDFKSDLNIFIKASLCCVFFVSFFHTLFLFFMPPVFIAISMLYRLRDRLEYIQLRRRYILMFFIMFNIIFMFELIVNIKSVEFAFIKKTLEGVYQHLPLGQNSKKCSLAAISKEFTATTQESKINDLFLKITSVPFERNIYYYLAVNEFNLTKDYNKTILLLNKSVELSPMDRLTALYKANLEYNSGQYLEAQKTCKTFLNSGLQGFWLRKILGDIYLQSGLQNEALMQYQLSKKEYDLQFNRATQETLSLINDGLAQRNLLVSSIDSLQKDLKNLTAHDIIQKIESTPEYNASLAYNPRSGRIFFSSDLINTYDLYSFESKSNTINQLTKFVNYSPTRLRFSLSQNRIYFTSDWQGNYYNNIFYWDIGKRTYKKITTYIKADAKEYELSPDESKIAFILYKYNEKDLYIFNNFLNNTIQLTTDGLIKHYPCWSPDSNNIAYTCEKNGLCLYNIPDSSNKRLIGHFKKYLRTLRFTLDGTGILLAGEINEHWGQIFEYVLKQDKIIQLTQGDDLKLFPFPIDRNHFVYIRKHQDNYLLRLVDTLTGKDTPIGPSQGVVYGPSLVLASQQLLFLFSDNSAPCTICSLSLREGKFKKLIKLDSINNDDIILPQYLNIKAIDNYQIPVYYYPPYHYDATKKYPVIIWFHGGNEDFSPRWQMQTQYFAMNGFAVFAINYRMYNTSDVMQLYQYIKKDKSLDDTKVFLAGVSAGAIIIEKTLKELPGIFDGAVELSGLVNKYLDAPIKDLPPMEIIIGKNDTEINIDQKLKQALIQEKKGGKIKFVIIRNEGHDFRSQNSIDKTLTETADFLKRLRN